MAWGYQRLTLIGNLGRDPELKYTPSGAAVCNASLAVNRSYSDSNGQRHEETEWFRLVFWNTAAETFSSYATKGRPLFIEGRIQSRKFTDNAGVERTSYDVHVNHWQLLGERPAEEDGEPPF